ncbi:hypothetical protein DPMN_115840 [Dreissena polymorpha]|uniref:Apple domain-containing protein n=1 Tax=Dreissena polymorpha TaxID=45954 RepID=A0A9D4KMN3_DREPO|nr:hypothetical protein DPMN_115840 [Dreissena polymorpha]
MPRKFMQKYVMLVLLLSDAANATFQRHIFKQVELAVNATCFPAILVTPIGSAVRCASKCSQDENCVGFLTDAAEKCFIVPSNVTGITEVCNLSGVRYFRLYHSAAHGFDFFGDNIGDSSSEDPGDE